MKNTILLIALCFAFSMNILAQDDEAPNWMNASFKHNFYDIQADFNKYWEGHNITPKTPREKRAGWKQFKRWEWFWEQRVTPTGVFPKPGHNMEEYLKYKNSNKTDKYDKKQAGDWVHLGPSTATGGYTGLGRLNCVIEDPLYNGTTNKTIWVGAASGGVWKSTNGGTSWTTNTDWFAALGIADIVIDPTNTNIMYVATGDGDANDTYSIGVLKSTDAGNTWNITSLQHQVTEQKVCRRMVINPTNTNILLVATSSGLFRTTNAGSTWTQVRSGQHWDVKLHPQNPNIVYAATTSMVYKSIDAGATWNSGVSLTSSTRIALAVSPNQPGYVFALSTSSGAYNGLWRSTDSAATFTKQSSSPNLLNSSSTGSGTGGQGWYDLSLAVDPTNANNIYVGGVNIWKSTDAGVTWAIKGYWTYMSGVATVHADHHMFYFGGTNRLYSANDGGLDLTTNGGTNWTFLGSGLKITQFYRIATSQTNANHVLAGAQDNSSFLKTSTSFGMTLATGDGMDQAINPSNGNYMYTSSYYGNISRSTNAGTSWSDLTTPNESGGWVTPYVIDPNNHSTLVAGYLGVWKSTNNGTNWTKISNFTNSSTLSVLHVAPANSNYIYAGRSSALWKTTDGGTTWSSITLPYSSLTSLTSNNNDANEIWITMSGYSSTNKVFKSTNGGTTWTNITGSLPNVPCNHILFQPNTDKRVWVATDIGVWFRGNTNTNWEDYNDNLPNVICNDLEIYTAGNKLRLGTYGRGLWEATLPGVANLPPSLASPANTSDELPIQLNLQWNASFGATNYRLQISTSSTFSTLLVNTVTNANNYNVASLQFNTQYYWRVRSMNATDTSDWSEVWNFKTKLPIYAPSIVSPENGTNIHATNATFVWNVEPDAINYRIQIASDSLFNNILINQTTSDTSYVWSNLIQSSRFFWRVQAFNALYTSLWSEFRNFTTYAITAITIGTGTNAIDIPYHTYYADATTYLLYTASEISAAGGGAGSITSLAFDVVTPNNQLQPLEGFSIFMQNTNSSTVSTPVTSGWTQVYTTSSYTVNQAGWNTHNFNSPFTYDPTKNLLVKVCFNNPNNSWTSNSTVRATSASGKVYARRSDTNSYTCLIDPPQAYTLTNRPNVKLTFTTSLVPPELFTPANNAVLNVDNLNFKWRKVSMATAYHLMITHNTYGVLLNTTTTDTSFSPAPLGIEGDYVWRVRTISNSDSSSWNTANFQINRIQVNHQLNLHLGLNMISSYSEPDSTSFNHITSGIINKFSLIKNVTGEVFSPPFINTLSNWNIRNAYQIRMHSNEVLPINGKRIIPNTTPIIMNKLGWFWMPYFRTGSMATSAALASISNKFVQVKSIEGLVYQPPFFNTLQNLTPGKGYMIRISSPDAVLLYPANTYIKSSADNSEIPEPRFFVREKKITGKTAVVTLDIDGIDHGDEIAAYDSKGMLVGSSVWSDFSKGIVIFGDDSFTQSKDGAYEGESINLKVWKSASNNIHSISINNLSELTGARFEYSLNYHTDAIYHINASLENPIEKSIRISPQPASNELYVRINNTQAENAEVKVYDYRGYELLNENLTLNNSQLKLNTAYLPNGIYQIVISIDGQIYKDKFVVLK